MLQRIYKNEWIVVSLCEHRGMRLEKDEMCKVSLNIKGLQYQHMTNAPTKIHVSSLIVLLLYPVPS